jgi:RNA recognition motif-containing protein
MSNKVFLGNLAWSVTSEGLESLLRADGYAFKSARVILDRETGRSRGFAFVEFETPEAAREAIETLDGHVVEDRPLRASEANEPSRSAGGRGGRGRSERGGGDGDEYGRSWED